RRHTRFSRDWSSDVCSSDLKLSKFSQHWSPKIIAQLNDYHLKLAKVQGEFVWHDHPETDEVFIIVKGHLDILFRDGKVSLTEGRSEERRVGKECRWEGWT